MGLTGMRAPRRHSGAAPMANLGSTLLQECSMTFSKTIVLLGTCTALGAGAAFAADSGDIVPPPAAVKYERVDVINGGATFEEADAIKRIAPQYKLRVEISGHGGDYFVADKMKVIQKGQQGKQEAVSTVIAEIPNAGPWLLLDVPAGRYTLLGDFGTTQVKRDVVVAGSGTTVHFVVPPNLN